jgi:hypothetical protein
MSNRQKFGKIMIILGSLPVTTNSFEEPEGILKTVHFDFRSCFLGFAVGGHEMLNEIRMPSEMYATTR